jgi:nucleotide-binding universal stress UspA family protein
MATRNGAAPLVRRILCPIDFSDFSPAAAGQAALLASGTGARVTAMFVFPIPTAWMASGSPPAEPGSSVKSVVAQDLATLFRTAGDHPTPVDVLIRTGDPAREIVAAADRLRADVIVMATHGRSGFDRWVLGSVTDKVLRRATCPVLTVSPSAGAPEGAHPRPNGRVLCAVDLSRASRRTLSLAVCLARWMRARLTALHVVEGVPVRAGRTAQASARRRLQQEVAAAGGEAAETLVRAGRPYREILRAARERGAGLIVVGVHGDDAEDGRFFGATADHVVRQSTVPVVTVPDVAGDRRAKASSRPRPRPGAPGAPRAARA